LKAFENQEAWPGPVFKSSRCCAASFSEENFFMENIFGGFENGKSALAGFQMLSVQLRELCRLAQTLGKLKSFWQ
jgi:hypothetical protein